MSPYRIALCAALYLSAFLWCIPTAFGQISLSLPTVSTDAATITLPVTVSDLSAQNVFSAEFSITYDPAVLILTGASFENTLSSGSLVAVNTTVPGEIQIALASTNPLSGSGTLLNLTGTPVATGTSNLTWTASLLNEGLPTHSVTNGSITVSAQATLSLPTLVRANIPFDIPVTLTNTSGTPTFSYQLELTYDPSLVSITGISTTSTLSEGFLIISNTTTPGQVKVAAAGGSPLPQASGTLLHLQATPIASGSTPLTVVSALLNEGEPLLGTSDGALTIASDPGLYQAVLVITDANNNSTNLIFGTAPGATDDFDNEVDQLAPPAPPVGSFDARLRGTDDFLTDMRAPEPNQHTWRVVFQPSAGGTPVFVSWNRDQLPSEGTFRIQDTIDGSLLDIDMRSQAGFSVPTSLTQLQIVFSLEQTLDVPIAAGWNLLGLSLDASDASAVALYPNARPGTFFAFNGSYFTPSPAVFTHGSAYWLNFSAAETASVTGRPLDGVTRIVVEGWNLISGPNCSVPFDTISDPNHVLLAGTLFAYSQGYQIADALETMQGYWVRATGSGELTLSCTTSSKQTARSVLDKAGHLIISDPSGDRQPLFYAVPTLNDLDPRSYTRPPIQPVSSLAVSYANGRYATQDDAQTIVVSGASGPYVTVKVVAEPVDAKRHVMIDADGNTHMLTLGAEFQVSPRDGLRLMPANTVPALLELAQNYPNPFSAETLIRFGVSESAPVSLKVYDVLGRLVAVLHEDQLLDAGWHEALFDASQLASGVYVYRLQVGAHHIVKHMLLLD